jgi:hypothetical protein
LSYRHLLLFKVISISENDGDTSNCDESEPGFLTRVTVNRLSIASSSTASHDRNWDAGQTDGDIHIRDVDVDESSGCLGGGIVGSCDTLAAEGGGGGGRRRRRRRRIISAEVNGETSNGNETTPLRGVTGNGVGIASSSPSANNRNWDAAQTNGDIDVGDIDVKKPNELLGLGIASGGNAGAALVGRSRGGRRRSIISAEVDGETSNGNNTTKAIVLASNWVAVASSSTAANYRDWDTIQTDGDIDIGDVDVNEPCGFLGRGIAGARHSGAALFRRSPTSRSGGSKGNKSREGEKFVLHVGDVGW